MIMAHPKPQAKLKDTQGPRSA